MPMKSRAGQLTSCKEHAVQAVSAPRKTKTAYQIPTQTGVHTGVASPTIAEKPLIGHATD